MIVEDEVEIIRMIEAWVIENTAYQVSVAFNAMEALEKFRTEKPDVVLSDIRMPKMSGQELLQEVKRIDPQVPFILMTGQGDIMDTISALRAGALDFFQKPFKMGALMASIDRAFGIINARDMKRTLRRYQTSEERSFDIPNEMNLVPSIVSELTESLVEDPRLDPVALEGLRAALHEMIINAIEHGNLEISFDEKSRLMESPHGWYKEVESRAASSRFADRRVKIEMRNSPESVGYTIADEGEGFNPATLPDPTDGGHLLHGRGILIARIHVDELRYNEVGNSVTMIKTKCDRIEHLDEFMADNADTKGLGEDA